MVEEENGGVEADLGEFVSTLRQDLTSARNRDRERLAAMPQSAPRLSSASQNVTAQNISPFQAFTGRSARTISLLMPVAGIAPGDLSDSWGNSRDGGRRRHRGIDIFAPRGTEIVAVADGLISYVGEQSKGGRCFWLTTEDGLSFFYAHLDRWAVGLYEGMSVRAGDVLGYVGNTGNARSTPSHLHFAVHQDDEAVNPYPLLKSGIISRGTLHGGFGRGTR